VLEEIHRRYPEQVVLILRHLPLPNHEHAVAAARAAECAAEQNQFAAYHDLLFIHQANLSNAPWSELAKQSGVSDIVAFKECTGAGVTNAQVERDVEAARALGIRSVPTFIVNGSLVSGAVSVEVLDRMVRRAMSDHNG
jgi:protein-disulfide isomerase